MLRHDRRAASIVERDIAMHLAIDLEPGPLSCRMASVWRILTADGWSELLKLECDSSAALGVMPKRITFAPPSS